MNSWGRTELLPLFLPFRSKLRVQAFAYTRKAGRGAPGAEVVTDYFSANSLPIHGVCHLCRATLREGHTTQEFAGWEICSAAAMQATATALKRKLP